MARLVTSLAGPPWPAQIIRIARAALYLTALLFGQALATPSAAEGCLNSPRLKEKLCAVRADVRALGVVRRDPEK